MKIINHFVQEYKAILNMKKGTTVPTNKKQIIINVVFSTLLIVLVFGALAYLFRLTTNFHYVFISVNTVLVSSFVIFKYTNELLYQNKTSLQYNTSLAISYDVAQFVGILSLVNTFLLLVLFLKVVSLILVILSILIGIASLIYYNNIQLFCASPMEDYPNIWTVSIWIIVLYIGLFYILSIPTITMSYILTTMIVILIFLYRTHLQSFHSHVQQPIYYLILISILLIGRYAYLQYDNEADKQPFLIPEVTIKETLDNVNLYRLLYRDGYYYELTGGILSRYDADFTNKVDITPNLDNVYNYVFYNDELVAITNVTVVGNDDTADLYDITDPNNPVYMSTITTSRSIDQIILIIDHDNQPCLVLDNGNETVNLYSYTGDYISVFYLQDGTLLYQEENLKIIAKDGDAVLLGDNNAPLWIRPHEYFSNDTIATVNDNELCIQTLDEYLNPTDTKGECTTVSYSNLYNYYFDGSNYYISATDENVEKIFVYNSSLKETQVALEVGGVKYIQNNMLYSTSTSYKDPDTGKYITHYSTSILDPKNITHFVINDKSKYVTYPSILGIMIIFTLIPISLPEFRGCKN